MLVDGVFNADPHPGNVLLMPDGRLGLIDYGQVMRLSDAQRRTLAALLVALAAQDEAAAVAGATAMGFRTRRMDPAVLAQLAAFFFDRDDYDRFGVEDGGGGGGPVVAYSPARTLKRLNGADKLVVVPEEYILAARVSLLLRGTSQLMARGRVALAVCWRGVREAGAARDGGRGGVDRTLFRRSRWRSRCGAGAGAGFETGTAPALAGHRGHRIRSRGRGCGIRCGRGRRGLRGCRHGRGCRRGRRCRRRERQGPQARARRRCWRRWLRSVRRRLAARATVAAAASAAASSCSAFGIVSGSSPAAVDPARRRRLRRVAVLRRYRRLELRHRRGLRLRDRRGRPPPSAAAASTSSAVSAPLPPPPSRAAVSR